MERSGICAKFFIQAHLVAELASFKAANAADASPIRRAEKKNKIRTERAGKRF